MADSYPLFPIFPLISFVLVLVPLPWHLQAMNTGTCLFMIWTAIGCLNQAINSIVWHKSIVDRAPLWCDISTRLTVGIAVAIPAASLCINRRLYKIATCQTATITYAQKKRAALVDLSIGLGIPALQMILQFIVQGHRYDLFEDIGCLPTTVNTPAAYPLSFIWPNVICMVSAVYCILTLRAFMKRRAQFSQFLSSTTSLSVDRYFRLICLATTEIFLTVPISTYTLYLNITSKPIYHWVSWSDTHFDFYIIDVYPAKLWQSNSVFASILEVDRWSVVICAIIFFAFFGLAEEARKNYKAAYRFIARRLGLNPPSDTKKSLDTKFGLPLKNVSGPNLPDFVHQKKDPLDSEKGYSSFSTFSQDTIDVSDYTETLYGSPLSAQAKFDIKFPRTPDSVRFSRMTV